MTEQFDEYATCPVCWAFGLKEQIGVHDCEGFLRRARERREAHERRQRRPGIDP